MSEERKIQLGVSVNANSAREGFNEVRAGAVEMARGVTRAATDAGVAIDGIGASAASSAQRVEAAERNLIGSIQRATAAAQAGQRSGAAYFEALATQRGVDPRALEPYLAQLRAVESAQNSAGMSARATAAAMRGVPAQIGAIAVQSQRLLGKAVADRRKTNGVSHVDPSQDLANWVQISSGAVGMQTFTTSGIFNPIPGASYYLIDLVGGGGSGTCSTASGGGAAAGGGGGERLMRILPASAVSAPVAVTVGAGGASTTVAGSGNQVSQGNSGGSTTFGSLLIAHGGVAQNYYTGGAGGGIAMVQPGQGPVHGQCGTSGATTQPFNAEWGGASGGGIGVGNVPIAGGSSIYGGAGGGAAYISVGASAGGKSGSYTAGGGAIGSVGGIGVAGADSTSALVSGSGGAGVWSNTTATGGAGGFPGGGGGGACTNGTGAATSGKGGDGVARIYWW